MNKPFIIGIAGGSGSGKTFFLKCFPWNTLQMPKSAWYRRMTIIFPVAHNMTKEENKLYNFDLPATIDRDSLSRMTLPTAEQVVKPCRIKRNTPLIILHAVPKTLEIKPAPVLLIVEGLFILHFTEIAKMRSTSKYLSRLMMT